MSELEKYQYRSTVKMAVKAKTGYDAGFLWEGNFRENHCTMDTVNLEADNGSRGCRTPHEKALTFKHRPRRLEAPQDKGKLDESRCRSRCDGEDGRGKEKTWNENDVRRKKNI